MAGEPAGREARHLVQRARLLGAPDPELNTSPIVDESQLGHFNNEEFPIGTFVQSGDEVLECTGRGVWERRGDKHP